MFAADGNEKLGTGSNQVGEPRSWLAEPSRGTSTASSDQMVQIVDTETEYLYSQAQGEIGLLYVSAISIFIPRLYKFPRAVV